MSETPPASPARGFLDGARAILGRAGIPPADVPAIAHATTLVTNAFIERQGAPTG